MAETARVAIGFIQLFDNGHSRVVNSFQEHLRDPVTPIDRIGCLPEIDDRDFNFAPVIGVNGSWRIDQPD